MTDATVTRRDWIGGAAATAGLLPFAQSASARRIAASDRVNVAVIGATLTQLGRAHV